MTPLPQIKIMIVDDAPEITAAIKHMLQGKGYEVSFFHRGQLALEAALQDPPGLILLDINMPEMDGFTFCRLLKTQSITRDVPVIFISVQAEPGEKVKAFECGGVDYITKPFNQAELAARVETHLTLHRHQQDLERLVANQIRELSSAQIATIVALAKLAESRDDDTGKHIERVQEYCRILAAHILSAESPHTVQAMYHASALHDIGKVAIRDSILLKGGPLTAGEFATMQTHTLIGARTLEKVQRQYPGNALISAGILIARSHHERWDGTGYPDGLHGETIPVCARIMAVADVYDALRSKRAYKQALPHDDCCKIISKSSGRHFDPAIVDVFQTYEREFEDVYERLRRPTDPQLYLGRPN